MTQQGRWRRRLGASLPTLILPWLAGCLGVLHPVEVVTAAKPAPTLELPKECRRHVHVFFVHGMDPLDFANLQGVCEYVQSLGFPKTYYGQMYHYWSFEKEIRRIHQEDPEARFALVGFSFGANLVRDLANGALKDGIPIDLLVYLGGNTFDNAEEDRPARVGKIINILATGWVWHGADLDGAENLQYSDVWHFGSPSHHHTLDVLRRELDVVAQRVPVVERAAPAPAPASPTPRPVLPEPAGGARGEWDFLKPDGGLQGRAESAPGRVAGEAPPATMKIP